MLKYTIFLFFYIAAFSSAPASGQSSCSFTNPCNLVGGDILQQPRHLVSSDGTLSLTLNVEVADFTVDWLSLQRRTYNGEIPSPTWRVKRNDVIKLDLYNDLQEPEKTEPINTSRFPNTTNMHTHGLHISPQVPEDDVLVTAPPGGSLHYEYNIEENHPSGTFWFHPHIHGSTLFQLHSGMAGMIIVEDEEDDINLSDQLKSVSCPFNCQHDIQLIFQPTLLYSNVKTAYQFASMQDDIEDNVENLANYIVESSGETFKDWISDDANGISYFTTNGQFQPTLYLKAGQLQRFRLLNAGGGPTLEVELVNEKGVPACNIHEIAIDGVYLNEARPMKQGKSLMAPSTRVDWLIACSKPGTYVNNGFNAGLFYPPRIPQMAKTTLDLHIASLIFATDILRSNPSSVDDMSLGLLTRYTGTLLTIKVSGNMVNTIPIDTSLPKRPDYVGDFMSASQDDVNGRFVVELSPITALNREKFPPDIVYRYKIEVGELQEWYLINTSPTVNHPVHVHVNHFQVVEYTSYTGPYGVNSHSDFMFYSQNNETCYFQHSGYSANSEITIPDDPLKYLGHNDRWMAGGNGTLGYAEAGEFRDNLLVPPLSNITIRFMPHKFTGALVIHCHLLNHEDHGMMMVVGIVPKGEDLSAEVPSGNAYPGTCMRCDLFPFNKDVSECLNEKPVNFAKLCDPNIDPDHCDALAMFPNKLLAIAATLIAIILLK